MPVSPAQNDGSQQKKVPAGRSPFAGIARIRSLGVAVGALPDGIPVIVSGSGDCTVRVWRLADGTPVGEPLTGHTGWVNAVAVGTLPDGTPVIISGSIDGTVRMWRLADGTLVVPPWIYQIGKGCRRLRQQSHKLDGRHAATTAGACPVSGR